MKKISRFISILITVVLFSNCGFKSSSSPSYFSVTPDGSNTMTVATGCGYWNEPCVAVTVCMPGSTSQCQTIPNILVDTGSSGLRLFNQATDLALPQVNAPQGGALAECTQYADGTAQWGPVVSAAVVLGGEAAMNVRMQMVNRDFPGSSSCASYANLDNISTAQYNGILGVGIGTADCGTYCTSNAGMYKSCTGSSCSDITLDPTLQVTNPVASFATDKQGVIFNLPTVADSGQNGATGTITFGIGTKPNNAAAAGAKIFSANSAGYFTVTYGGTAYNESFFDSGSNAYYFVDNSITQCSGDVQGFYCPGSELIGKTASLTAADSSTATLTFNIQSASVLESNGGGKYNAFNNLGGVEGSLATSFDIGYPFFLGRSVYIALDSFSGSYPYGYWSYVP